MPTITTLPAIVRMIGVDDCPGGTCPHCGATGRWIYNFECEDGSVRGAMAGCLKLFPQAPEIARRASYAKLRAAGGMTQREKADAQSSRLSEMFAASQAKDDAVATAKNALDTFCRWLNDETEKIEDAGESAREFRLSHRGTVAALQADFDSSQGGVR